MHYDIDLNDIKEYMHHDKLNIKNAALLIIDMQEAFRVVTPLISDKQINNVKSLIEFANKHSMEIIYVRHNDSSPDSKHTISWWSGDKIEYGSEQWQIIPELDSINKIIIDKVQYSAFFNTHLGNVLHSKGITDIVICGVMANCCCDTTARDAFMRGYNVFFINDATATTNRELHLSAIRNLAFGFANILNTSDLIS